jgi:hypothetical protein
VVFHPAGHVAAGQPAPDPRGVLGLWPVIAGQVEPRQPARQPGDGVQRLQDALAGYPVTHAQQGGPGVAAEILLLPGRRGRHIPARRDHQ